MASGIAVAPPPPPSIEPSTGAGNFSSALSAAGSTAGSPNSGASNGAQEFMAVAAKTPGVNVQDGISGNEYLKVANSINDNPALKDKFQSIDTTAGNAAPELFGQYGLEGRNLLDLNGKPAMTVDDAAASLNNRMKPSEQQQTEESQGAEAAGGGGCGGAGGAGGAEKSGGAGGGCGGAGGAGDLTSLFPFLLGLLDEDGDGKISPEEMAKGMAKMDSNKDGKISREELISAGASEDQADRLMASMDQNSDSSIALDGAGSEMQAFMSSANANGDLEISQDELNTILESSQTATKAPAPALQTAA